MGVEDRKSEGNEATAIHTFIMKAIKDSQKEYEFDENNPFLTVEMFENIDFPKQIPTYQESGANSFLEDDDRDKLEYIRSLGIQLYGYGLCIGEIGEITDRAILVTAFLVLPDILTIGKSKNDGKDVSKIIPTFIEKWERERIGNQERALEEECEGLAYDLKRLAANPTLKVTRRELHIIIKKIFEDLKDGR